MAGATKKIMFTGRPKSVGPGGAWTYLKIPFDIEKQFGSRARVAVKGTLNGFPYRTSILPDGKGHHNMMFNKDMQQSRAPGREIPCASQCSSIPRRAKSRCPRTSKRRWGRMRARRRVSGNSRRRTNATTCAGSRRPNEPKRALRALKELCRCSPPASGCGEVERDPAMPVKPRPLGVVPSAGKYPVTRNMWHACARHTLAEHFAHRAR